MLHLNTEKGAFSDVMQCTQRDSGKEFAVKCIKRAYLTKPEEVKALQMEVDVLSRIDHPHVMSMVDFYEEPKVSYIVSELLGGGELFDRIVQKEVRI